MIEFPFIEFETEDLGKILKPFAFVKLVNGKRTLAKYPLLIDSGADVTLVPKSTGKKLGLKLKDKSEIKFLGGISGSVPVVYKTIDLRIENIKFSTRIAWAQIEDVPPVLGRIDIFDKFDIEFKQVDRKIIFKVR